ncbi:MAG: glycosyl hydrolase 115 family protein [Brevundimonas sp.]|uniref:glycosyl hydrolase 115 family protein n=1 Tax=Brevundimonas sp. TaxID=1871086 RepID=UPI00391A113B
MPRFVTGFLALCLLWLGAALPASACEAPGAVCPGAASGDAFALVASGRPTVVRTDPGDHAGLLRAAADLRGDLERVSGSPSPLNHEAGQGLAVIVGTLGRNAVIDALVADGRLDVSDVTGQWEAFVQQVIDNPAPGVDRALVIAGSDMRGAIYGVYDLSERMGVSPWFWWADVPVARQGDLHVLPGRRADRPRVRYRGIFLNDENPALYGWVNETFGGFNHHFYTRVFELTLRLKSNYLWPAMWGKAFSDDDPLNAVMADQWGVVIGTSHHEPMMRAHVEWERYGVGAWDYATNPDALRRFWREGVTRMGDHESLVTVGMRGDGDEAMTEDTATALLETIVADQRAIIAEVTGRDPAETPQVWALYKEVQDYYDDGMRVPDDVTLLFADDNWGNIRRLPAPGSERPGGYGVYFHFDYVGGPRNYKWLNTTQVERTWEQMNLAWEYGADRLWIVNVGDLKPMELPISAFMAQAWNPETMTLEAMTAFTRDWAAQQFGDAHADEIADLLRLYTRYNSRRKPELIGPDTFSLLHHNEAERVTADWAELAARADAVRAALPPEYDDAFVQLVWFPIHASGNLTALHVETGRNRLYAAQGRAAAADAAAGRVRALFARDAELTRIYHEDVADGRWNHMMSQTHISYTYWQQPDEDVLPDLAEAAPVAGAALGLAVEGDARAWPDTSGGPALPPLHRHGVESRWIDLFDRGDQPVAWTLEAGQPWIRLSAAEGRGDARVRVSVDWAAAPEGQAEGAVRVRGADGTEITVLAPIANPAAPVEPGRFIEADGHVTMEAEHYARAVAAHGVDWRVIPGLGRTLSGVTTTPSTAAASEPGEGPWLEYDVHLFEPGEVQLRLVLSPTLDFTGGEGLRYAVSIGDGPVQVVTLNATDTAAAWEGDVANAVAVHTTRHAVGQAGSHTVRVWRIDPGVVIQRAMIVRDGAPDSYLGPLESRRAE